MKKLTALVLSLLLATGCTPKAPQTAATTAPSQSPAAVQTSPATEQAPPAAAGYDESLITEVKKQLLYNPDNWDTPITCNYRLPQLLKNTRTALEINSEIISFLPQVGQDPIYDLAQWEGHWNGSLLSLVIRLKYTYSEVYDYKVYNYDFETDQLLTNQDLFFRCNLWEEEILSDLQRSAIRELEKASRGWNDFSFSDLQLYRAMTLYHENLNLESNPFFLDDQGNLCAIADIATPAGGGYIRQPITLDHAGNVEKAVDDGYVLAQLKHDSLTITYQEKPDSSWSVSTDYLIHDQPMQVGGLYGHYTDIAIGNLGWEFWPMVLLLDDQGRISFCDLMLTAESSLQPMAVGPLPEPSGLTGFTTAENPYGGQQLMGLRGDEVVDLHPYIYDACGTVPNLLGDWPFVTEDEAGGFLYTPQDRTCDFYWQSYGETIGSGLLTYLGVDTTGMYYSYSLSAEHTSTGGILCLEVFPANWESSFRLFIKNDTQRGVSGLPGHALQELFPVFREY